MHAWAGFIVLMGLGCQGPAVRHRPVLELLPIENSLVGAKSPVLVAMQRTPCEGACPVYELVVHADGTLRYLGVKFVKEVGVRTAHVDSVQLSRIRDALARVIVPPEDYDEYPCPHGVIDLGGVSLLIPSIVPVPICYVDLALLGRAPMFGGVDYALDGIVGSGRWVGKSND